MNHGSLKPVTSVIVAFVLAVASSSRADDLLDAGSRHLRFHARIKQGNPPLIGNHTLTFNIYDGPAARGALPGGGPFEVPVNILPQDDSVVTVLVPGNKAGLPASLFDGSARYLGVAIDGNAELTPRFQLPVAGYSMRTNFVGNVELIDDVELGSASATGSLSVFHNGSAKPVATITGGNAQLRTFDSSHVETLNAGTSGNGGGFVILRQDGGSLGLQLDGFVPGQGGVIVGRTNAAGAGRSYELIGNDGDGAGRVTLYDGAPDPGSARVRIDAKGANGGAGFNMWNSFGVETVHVDANDNLNAGLIALRNQSGNATIGIQSDGGDGAGFIRVRNNAEENRIILDASDAGGKGRVITDIMEIRGGADLSERFDIAAAAGASPQAGMVVSIDPMRPGKLVVSNRPYDRTVAGIISGAGGVLPGVLLSQAGSVADGRHPVALSGRVYCMVDATYGAIVPGDLLTSSATPGHAMKVADHAAAQGAILGKAMTGLSEGKGLVLVLVTLQ